MNGFSTGAVSEAGKAAALAVVLSMAAVYVPPLALLLLPALPLPVGFVTMRRGLRVGLAAAVATSALGLLFAGVSEGLTAVLFAGVLGVLVGTVLGWRWSFSPTLLVVTAGAGLVIAGWTAALWIITGLDQAQLSKLVDESLAAAAEVYRGLGVAEATVSQATAQVREWLRLVPYVLPAALGIGGLILGAASLGLAAAVFPRVGEPLAGDLRFAEFRLHWSMAYGFIGGLALLLVAPSFGARSEAARLVGLNLLMFFETLFFVQGLAVAHWFVVTRGMSGGKRVVVYGVALLGQMSLQLTSWAGLLDTWFDYRKRFPPRGPGRKKVAPADPGGGDQEES
ncbi:MAG: YybS family protein [Thermoleophilia bacterium]